MDSIRIWHPVKPPQACFKKTNQGTQKMTTNEKLTEILKRLITTAIKEQNELVETSVGHSPASDSRLEKIAHNLVTKAERDDIKAIDKIQEIVGDVEWDV